MSISQNKTKSAAELEAATSHPIEPGGILRIKFADIQTKTLLRVALAHHNGLISLYDLARANVPLPQLLGEIQRRTERGEA